MRQTIKRKWRKFWKPWINSGSSRFTTLLDPQYMNWEIQVCKHTLFRPSYTTSTRSGLKRELKCWTITLCYHDTNNYISYLYTPMSGTWTTNHRPKIQVHRFILHHPEFGMPFTYRNILAPHHRMRHRVPQLNNAVKPSRQELRQGGMSSQRPELIGVAQHYRAKPEVQWTH